MIFLEADIYLKSDKSLEEVGEILSKELFGGLPFGGRENYIRDEIPTIYIEPEIMGTEVILMGGDVDGVCILQLYPSDRFVNCVKEAIDLQNFDLAEYIGFLLKNNNDLKIMTREEIKEFEAKFED